MTGKKIIITGASGFVGANLARRALREGHAVHLFLREQSDGWRINDILPQVRVWRLDLADAEKVKETVSAIKPEWVFHLAAYGAYSWQNDFNKMVQTNIAGTANLLDAALAAGFAAFINTGSSSEYGFKDHPAAETEALAPNSGYAVTKATATNFCQQRAAQHKVFIATLRLYSAYGPYEDPGRLIPALISAGMEARYPPLVAPDVARDFVYVEDVLAAYFLAAECRQAAKSGIYNVGSGVQTSIRTAVDVSRKIFKIKSAPQWGSLPNRIWDTNVWVADNRKIKKALCWKPKTDFARGFAQTVRWYKENSQFWGRYNSGK